jgi:hypothetical protein
VILAGIDVNSMLKPFAEKSSQEHVLRHILPRSLYQPRFHDMQLG